MNENEFEMFLDDFFNDISEKYIDISVFSDKPHEFSEKFQKKIRKLIRRSRRFYFPIVKTGLRRTITITVVMIIMMFTAVMSVGAWRRAFFSFITKPFTTHTDIEAVKDHAAPTVIEENYEPGFVPDGFSLSEKEDIRELCSTRVYTGSGGRIDFEQWVRSKYDQGVNTEGYDMEPVTINGYEGFIVRMDDVERCFVSWDSGDYIFQITGSVDADTALKIAKSVRKE